MELNFDPAKIRVLRCRLGCCQSAFARKLDVPSSLVRAWEQGDAQPTTDQKQVLELLFRQTETSVLEILQSPMAEKILDSTVLGSVQLRDLTQK